MTTEKFSTSILINADPQRVWTVLTEPKWMTQWLGDPAMKIEVETNWEKGSPVLIRGLHHVAFENRGVVLEYDKPRKLTYSHLSSISRLADHPDNYSLIEFMLTPAGGMTELRIEISNFPTESIRHHLEFYWKGTLSVIKDAIEN